MEIGKMSLAELVAHVQSALAATGISTVLSGGSCVTIWSENAYRSDDIDLIPDGLGQRTRIRAVMLALGFTEQNRYFVHPDATLFIEFPSGPLAVGEERPKEITEVSTATGTMRLLSPTDCVKDRLTWWFHNQERQCLHQAIAVARCSKVDLKELRRWSVGERKSAEFEEIATNFMHRGK